jgi:hypothetical protein
MDIRGHLATPQRQIVLSERHWLGAENRKPLADVVSREAKLLAATPRQYSKTGNRSGQVSRIEIILHEFRRIWPAHRDSAAMN